MARRIAHKAAAGAAVTSLLVIAGAASAEQPALTPAASHDRSGAALYAAACANCHGWDGRGTSAALVAFREPLPDFSDCAFATREPDSDWFAVAHAGGPARAFARMMPAFGGALGRDEIQRVLTHIRSFCADAAWPRGELNLPRPLITEKSVSRG